MQISFHALTTFVASSGSTNSQRFTFWECCQTTNNYGYSAVENKKKFHRRI